MNAADEIRNASQLVSDDSNEALVNLFGDEGPVLKAVFVKDMGENDAACFTIGLVVGAQLMQSRMEREGIE